MEIPGFAPYSGQPTTTNPLSQQSLITGQQPASQQQSEAVDTVTNSEQEPASLTTNQVVEQTTETSESGFDNDNPGGTIDITA